MKSKRGSVRDELKLGSRRNRQFSPYQRLRRDCNNFGINTSFCQLFSLSFAFPLRTPQGGIEKNLCAFAVKDMVL